MKGPKLIVLIALLAAIGGVLYVRFGRPASGADDLRKQIVERLPQIKDYAKHKAQLDVWVNDAHRVAVEASGGAADFDEDAYLNAFIESLCDQAQKLNEAGKELELSLRQFGTALDNEMAAKRE